MAYIAYPIEESFLVDQQQIYKYADIKTAKLILSNSTLRFTNPKDFNDPFDCNPAILEFYKTKASVQEFKEAINSTSWSRQKRREYLNSINNPKEFLKLYSHVIENKISNSGVTCFSRTYDNTLMWSHYSDQHRGVCLQFDASLDMGEMLEDEALGMLAAVNYGKTNKVNYNKDKIKATVELFNRKSSDWEYEKEIRLVVINKKNLLKFNKDFLTGIVFGCRTSKDDQEEIITLIKAKGYNVSMLKASKGAFKLRFKQVN